MTLPLQIVCLFAALWLAAWVWASVRERRRQRREDEAWVDARIALYHADLARRFRNGQFKPKDKYGRFSCPTQPK